jgi:hypothetical protein
MAAKNQPDCHSSHQDYTVNNDKNIWNIPFAFHGKAPRKIDFIKSLGIFEV